MTTLKSRSDGRTDKKRISDCRARSLNMVIMDNLLFVGLLL